RAARIALRVCMLVRRPMGVAMEMKVRASGVRVHVQMPPPPRVAQDDASAEPDQQDGDQEVGGGPEPVGKPQPEQDDRAHDAADARYPPVNARVSEILEKIRRDCREFGLERRNEGNERQVEEFIARLREEFGERVVIERQRLSAWAGGQSRESEESQDVGDS